MGRHPQTWEGSQYCPWRGSKAAWNVVSPDPCPPPPRHPKPVSSDVYGETSIQSRGVVHWVWSCSSPSDGNQESVLCGSWPWRGDPFDTWVLIVRSLIDTKLGMACSQSSTCQGFSWVDDIGKGAQSRETVIRAEGVRRDEFLLGWVP